MTREGSSGSKPAYDGILPEEVATTPPKSAIESEGEAPFQNADAQVSGPPDMDQFEHPPSGPAYSSFNKHQKNMIIFVVALGGFFPPLSANIYLPALNALARDLRVSNELINLTLTSYMIFQGFAPTLLGDLGDMTGRRPAYVIGFLYI